MQTLISVFDDRARARKAVDRLVQAGFTHDDVHLQEAGEMSAPAAEDRARNQEIGERTMHTAEREVAVDRGVLDSLGNFFVSLFGEDRGEKAADGFRKSIERGHSIVIVDARNDHEAETAAVILHEQGAIDVDDHDTGSASTHAGVRMFERQPQPTLRDLARQRQLRQQSLLSDRAHASGTQVTPSDRPK